MRGVLRAARADLFCEVRVAGNAAAGESRLALGAEPSANDCPGVTGIVVDDVTGSTTTLHIDDAVGRHDLDVARVATR